MRATSASSAARNAAGSPSFEPRRIAKTRASGFQASTSSIRSSTSAVRARQNPASIIAGS
jgi:hypothetical protein